MSVLLSQQEQEAEAKKENRMSPVDQIKAMARALGARPKPGA